MSPAVRLASALVHFVWQGAAIAGALWAILRVARRAPADLRYLAACAALAATALAPVATWLVLGAGADEARLSHAGAVATSLGAPLDVVRVVAAPASAPGAAREHLARALCALWAAGALVMLVRLAGGHARVRRLAREATALPRELEALVARVARALGVRRVRARASDGVDAPAVVGIVHPLVLLPLAALAGMPAAAVEAIVAHEIAHVRRLDPLVNALQSLVVALLFFHPAVHWIARRVREEREHCCDDAAASFLGDRAAYARALVDLETARAAVVPFHVAIHGGGPLMQRIRRLLSPAVVTAHHTPRAGAPIAIAAVLAAVAALPAFACGSSAQQDEVAQTRAADSLPPSVTRWSPEIAAASARWSIDPDLVTIIVALESRGNPDAVSPAGAVGLMQIMPATAAKIAEARGLQDFRPESLRDPRTNLDFGAWYLAQQLATFAGAAQQTGSSETRSIELAAAAYNAGPDRVRAWLDDKAPLSEETLRYKAKVVDLWVRRHGAH